MPTISALTTFTATTRAKAAEVNANFSSIRTTVNAYAAFVDSAATITGAWTFTTAPTISGALTVGNALTVTTGGLTVTGASTITGTLGGLTGLTVASGGAAITGNSSVTGTLTATTFSGSGASLTNLPAANLTGTVANSALPSTIDGKTFTNVSAFTTASVTVTSNTTPLQISAATTTAGYALAMTDNARQAFLATGSQTVPTLSGTGPSAGVTGWKWLKCQVNGVEHFIPMLF